MVILGYGLGVFSVLFFIAWLDEREDIYAGICYKQTLDTCIEWACVLEGREVKRMERYRSSVYRYNKDRDRISKYG